MAQFNHITSGQDLATNSITTWPNCYLSPIASYLCQHWVPLSPGTWSPCWGESDAQVFFSKDHLQNPQGTEPSVWRTNATWERSLHPGRQDWEATLAAPTHKNTLGWTERCPFQPLLPASAKVENEVVSFGSIILALLILRLLFSWLWLTIHMKRQDLGPKSNEGAEHIVPNWD